MDVIGITVNKITMLGMTDSKQCSVSISTV